MENRKWEVSNRICLYRFVFLGDGNRELWSKYRTVRNLDICPCQHHDRTGVWCAWQNKHLSWPVLNGLKSNGNYYLLIEGCFYHQELLPQKRVSKWRKLRYNILRFETFLNVSLGLTWRYITFFSLSLSFLPPTLVTLFPEQVYFCPLFHITTWISIWYLAFTLKKCSLPKTRLWLKKIHWWFQHATKWTTKCWAGGLNPLTPMNDQYRISPYNINTISSRWVMRIKKNINLGIISRSNSKFSELTS